MASAEMMQELFAYVGWTDEDAALLARLGPALRPAFKSIVDEFYEAVEQNENARAVFRGGKPQIERQKHRLADWLEGIVGGVYDEAYFERRARIGRVHVQIDLDQRFMFSGMNIIRAGLHRALDASPDVTDEERRRGHVAIDRICDIELAIMLETYRERYVERQRANERLATIGQLAASIGHELRNPLAVMETSIHLLRRKVTDESARRHFDKIAQQIGISGAIIEDLLALARDRPPSREPVALRALAEEARDMVPPAAALEVVVDVPEDLPPVWVDRTQLRQVLVNLIGNAAEAILGSGKGGRIEVRAELSEGALVLSVTDDGPGFAKEVRERLFEPLVTTRRKGAGLGLALCARIVEKHHGTIDAEDPPGGGARVVVRIPDATQEPR
ncbi:MAG TPA: protoglobin domain-containing protein [Sandaracinaceae bacterium]